MAYKQNPGRGNNPKTGHGIPTPLMQMNREVVTKASEKMHKELNADPVGKGVQYQTTYDDQGGFKGKDSNISNVMAGDYIYRVQGGKTVATIAKSDKKGAKNFMSETAKQQEDQNFRRNKMAGYLNRRKASPVVN